MKYQEVIKHLIYDFKSESELVDSIKLISNGFTSHREKITNYLKEDKLVAAYTAFFFTSNFLKLDEIFKKILFLKDSFKDSEVIEVGAGPGSFTFNFAKYAKKVYAIETAPLMIRQSKKLNEEFFKCDNVHFSQNLSSLGEKNSFRILVFTNSSNEMSKEEVLKYIKTSNCDEVLFLEPGTMESFHSLLEIREDLLRSFNISYPCSNNNPCPLQDKNDWCHQYLKLDLDSDFKRIAQLVKINRKWQAICIHHYTKKENNNDDRSVVLRTYTKTKFSKDWQLCQNNKLVEFKNFKKDYSKSLYKDLDKVLAGDIIKYKTTKELKDKSIRGLYLPV